jgi:TonB family protein
VEPVQINEITLPAHWGKPLDEPNLGRRMVRAGVGSVAFHLLIGLLWTVLPASRPRSFIALNAIDFRKSIPLVAPHKKEYEPTQTAPNKGKVSRELDIRSAVPAPQPQAPRVQAPAASPGPVAQTPPIPAPAPVPVEPPKIEIAAAPPTQVTGVPTQPPPPPAAKPKLAFESVGANIPKPVDHPTIQSPPKRTVEEMARQPNPAGGGGVVVGDEGADLDTTPFSRQAPAPGRMASNLQLRSDAQGVDFKPYLIQVLAAVRRNWLAIIPESARLGRRGRVMLEFIIDRKGAVPKLVISSPSGTEAYDRAAVAGVSASYPFPPLPAGYKGDQIRLQMAFTYNGQFR